VVVGTRRFPPKQVLSEVTGLDRADFTTHQARRTLTRLGFSAGRKPASNSRPRTASPHTGTVESQNRLADRLWPYAGQWVAIKDDEVLHATESPHDLVGWLSQHGQKADSMFRVPEDERAATGVAPL
jgi:hypothetical protein